MKMYLRMIRSVKNPHPLDRGDKRISLSGSPELANAARHPTTVVLRSHVAKTRHGRAFRILPNEKTVRGRKLEQSFYKYRRMNSQIHLDTYMIDYFTEKYLIYASGPLPGDQRSVPRKISLPNLPITIYRPITGM